MDENALVKSSSKLEVKRFSRSLTQPPHHQKEITNFVKRLCWYKVTVYMRDFLFAASSFSNLAIFIRFCVIGI